MTGREWQPGDVARVTYSGVDQIALVRPRKEALGERLEFAYVSRGYDMVDDPDASGSARPLVVIDPEDREQVERLLCLFHQADQTTPAGMDRMRAALREFVTPTPPKPDEPTGLGAVVEDAKGALWVRAKGNAHWNPWHSATADWVRWAEIDAVKVVRDGYKPGEPSC